MKKWRTAWITGSSQGIGRALALRLAGDGIDVVASARGRPDLERLVSDAEGLPGTIRAWPLDVSDRDGHAESAARLIDQYGVPDLVVLNAGTYRPTPASEFNSKDLGELLAVNVMGVAHGLEAMLPAMIERGAGQIAVVASLAGYRGLPMAAAYGACKAGLINLCEALRLDLDGTGVRLQVINPGFVRTPLTDKNTFHMPFLMEVEDAVNAIVRGLHSDRFEIRFPTRFAWIMALLRHLPYRLYLPLVRSAIKRT